ncbi:MAG: CotH kinase family protein [Myxococcales bacterium]
MNTSRQLAHASSLWLVLCGACGEPAPEPPPGSDRAPPDAEDAGAEPSPGDDASPSPDAQDDAGTSDAAASDPWFSDEAFMQVEVELDPIDWQKLRGEGRQLDEILSGCEDKEFDYTTFEAKASINGHDFERVGVHKKGFLGSLSVLHPSLRIDLDEFVEKQELYGTKSFTLNNNQQDPTLIHQCMAYALFEAAGLATPRCSFAQVKVNGEALGVYTNVEPVKKPFLKRSFGDSKGDLYEGSAPADFRADLFLNFEKKTNEDQPMGATFEALAKLLENPPADLLGALDELIDVDEYLRFWAMESLLSHWDGYDGNRNNFFVYAAPGTQKLSFIPWGTDGAFSKIAYGPASPASVIVRSFLSGRIYATAEGRQRYRETLQELLDTVWDEDALLAEVDRYERFLGTAGIAKGFEQQREFIRARRGQIEPELAADAVALPYPEFASLACHRDLVSDVRVEFSAPWGDLEQLTLMSGNPVQLSLNGQAVVPLLSYASAGPLKDSLRPAGAVQMVLIMFDGSLTVLQWQLGRPAPELGELATHGFETFGVVLQGADAPHLQIVGFIGSGKIVFDKVGATGETVAGHFEGKFVPSVLGQ